MICDAGVLISIFDIVYFVLQQYEPGYTAIPRPQPDETTIDIG